VMISLIFLSSPALGQISLSPELEVYDPSGMTTGQAPKVKTVSIMELEECTNVQKIYHDPIQRKVQVLKKLDLVNINLLHCKVTLDYSTSYCGFDGGYTYSYGERALKHNVVQQLDGDLCHDLHQKEEIEVEIEGKSIKLQLEGGLTHGTFILEAKGSRTPDAGCEGVDITIDRVKYPSSVMTIQVNVFISKEAGKYDPDSELLIIPDKIILRPLQMNQTRKSKLAFENDVNRGTFLVSVDDLPRTGCELVENVFHGNASIFEPRKNAGTGQEEPTILIVRDDETHREISLSLREPQTICKRAMMATNQPNLFVRLLEVHEEPLSDEIRAARIEDMSEVEILATHITSSSVHDLLSLDNSMSQVSLALCNAKRAQQLQAMASMDDGSIHFGEASIGILAKRTGAVVRLYQGTPIQASLRADMNNSCYNDIPIRIKSHTGETLDLFADPLSLVILQTSPPVICSATPAMFQIKESKGNRQNTWYCITEKGPHSCQPPLTLAPHSIVWKNTGMGLNWLSLSIYDLKTIKKIHHFQISTDIREATHAKETISLIEGTESHTFLTGITRWGDETRKKVLKTLHPWTFSLISSLKQAFVIIGVTALIIPAIFFLILAVRLVVMCCRKGAGPLTISAVLRGARAAVSSRNDEMLASVKEHALLESSEDAENTAITEPHGSRETMEQLSKRTRHLERQVRDLLGKLSSMEERVSNLVVGQISLKTTLADATRTRNMPSAYGSKY
jgi:hypothetical protein